MAALDAAGGRNLIVEFPDEPVTGADMQWDFVNWDRKTFFRLLIQAKQLYDSDAPWRRHTYKHLLHPSGAGSTLQAKVLCDTARSKVHTYPLYAFYNPERSCSLARAAGAVNVEGVNLASGYVIERLAVNARTRAENSTPRRLRRYSLSLARRPFLSSFGPCALPVIDYAGFGTGPLITGFDGDG